MNKVYLAGKMSGANYLNTFEKFIRAENRLCRLGFQVVNPMNLVKNPSANRNLTIRICLGTMLEQCDTIFMLPDWKTSRGARLAYENANQLEFYLLTEDKVLEIEKFTIDTKKARGNNPSLLKIEKPLI
jgi:hypothetical protein